MEMHCSNCWGRFSLRPRSQWLTHPPLAIASANGENVYSVIERNCYKAHILNPPLRKMPNTESHDMQSEN